MLATLARRPPDDGGWVYERKLDGVRILAFAERGRVRLMSRNRKERTASYPEIAVAVALAAEPDRTFVVDGEVVAFEGSRTSFSRLQRRMQPRDGGTSKAGPVRISYHVFDVLHLDGHDVTGLALSDRKRILRRAFRWGGALRYTPHRTGGGDRLLAQACRRGWEGLIAKRAGAPYTHRRSRDWLKLKCGRRQELVVGGFTDPRGGRVGFGALLVGYYERGALRYAGKVGTGYDLETLSGLARRLAALEVRASPFADSRGLPARGVHWVRPRLVAEVGFTEWTEDGRLRHPTFCGLRDDKPPASVVRERPRA
jgi:bifunctional non-homologous end joining protein LigD